MPNYSNEPHTVPAEKDPLKSHIGIDTETTGLIPGVHGIASMAAIAHDRDGNELGRYYVPHMNPGNVEFDPEALAVNKLDPEKIKNGMPAADAFRGLLNFYRQHAAPRTITKDDGTSFQMPGHITIGHNVGFDINHILAGMKQHLSPEEHKEFAEMMRYKFDTMQHEPGKSPPTLGTAGKLHDVPTTGAHNSLADTEQALGIYHSMMGKRRLGDRLIKEEAARNAAPTPATAIKPKTPSIMDMMKDESSGPRPKVAGIKWMT
jgi:DNA polymerase III epsilon subunit-like protein